MKQSEQEFSKIRSFLWPIHGHELPKFFSMLVLFFLITFNYHLLRIAKDVLIITAPESGVEAIPFLKVWAVLPTAIFLTCAYTRVANYFDRENIFYVVTSAFLLFFALFIFVLYPQRENLYLHQTADTLKLYLPTGLYGLIAIVRYWMFSLFYVMGESWSNIMVSLLLWGFANDVTSVAESRRFYALFGVGTNSSGMLAGQVGLLLSSQASQSFLESGEAWDQTLNQFIYLVLGCGLGAMVIYRYLHRTFFQAHYLQVSKDAKQNKEKMSLRASVSYIARSRYLLAITAIVLCYNLVINLTEILWKSQMRELYPRSNDYTAYMSQVTFYIGVLATFTSYFISGNVIRSFGWRVSAFLTPGILLFSGLGFFYFFFLRQLSEGVGDAIVIMGMTPLALTVFFGSLQNCLGRAAKYTVFDDTKEMAFIPLNPEARFKGKAAIDGIVSRLGKSGGSLLMQGLLVIFSTPAACVPCIAAILGMALSTWMGAVQSLSKMFHQASADLADSQDLTPANASLPKELEKKTRIA